MLRDSRALVKAGLVRSGSVARAPAPARGLRLQSSRLRDCQRGALCKEEEENRELRRKACDATRQKRARGAQEMSIERECKRRRGVRRGTEQRRDAPTRRERRVRARNMLDADARVIIIAIE